MKKPRFVALVMTAIIAFAFPAGIGRCQSVSQEDTAMFQNGPQHQGVFETQIQGDLVGLKWRFETKGRVFASPVLYKERCIVGSADGSLYALDASSGTQLWEYKTGGAIYSTAAIKGNSAFVLSMDGKLHAVSLETGKSLWQFATKGEKRFDEWDALISSPVIDGNTVYFGSSDNNLYAVDAISGKLKWQFDSGKSIHSTPAVDSTSVYFGNYAGKVFALDKNTGSLKWSYKTKGYSDMPNGDIMSSPSVIDGSVCIGSKDHSIYVLEAATGKEIWKKQSYPGWVVSAPAVKDGKVFYGRTGDYMVYARDLKTGKTIWTRRTGYFIFGSPAIAGSTVFIGCFNGMLYALDFETGKLKWRYQTKGCDEKFNEFLTKSGEFNSKVYDKLNSLPPGQTSFDYLSQIAVVSSPWVSENTVYFGAADGGVYALEVK